MVITKTPDRIIYGYKIRNPFTGKTEYKTASWSLIKTTSSSQQWEQAQPFIVDVSE